MDTDRFRQQELPDGRVIYTPANMGAYVSHASFQPGPAWLNQFTQQELYGSVLRKALGKLTIDSMVLEPTDEFLGVPAVEIQVDGDYLSLYFNPMKCLQSELSLRTITSFYVAHTALSVEDEGVNAFRKSVFTAMRIPDDNWSGALLYASIRTSVGAGVDDVFSGPCVPEMFYSDRTLEHYNRLFVD